MPKYTSEGTFYKLFDDKKFAEDLLNFCKEAKLDVDFETGAGFNKLIRGYDPYQDKQEDYLSYPLDLRDSYNEKQKKQREMNNKYILNQWASCAKSKNTRCLLLFKEDEKKEKQYPYMLFYDDKGKLVSSKSQIDEMNAENEKELEELKKLEEPKEPIQGEEPKHPYPDVDKLLKKPVKKPKPIEKEPILPPKPIKPDSYPDKLPEEPKKSGENIPEIEDLLSELKLTEPPQMPIKMKKPRQGFFMVIARFFKPNSYQREYAEYERKMKQYNDYVKKKKTYDTFKKRIKKMKISDANIQKHQAYVDYLNQLNNYNNQMNDINSNQEIIQYNAAKKDYDEQVEKQEQWKAKAKQYNKEFTDYTTYEDKLRLAKVKADYQEERVKQYENALKAYIDFPATYKKYKHELVVYNNNKARKHEIEDTNKRISSVKKYIQVAIDERLKEEQNIEEEKKVSYGEYRYKLELGDEQYKDYQELDKQLPEKKEESDYYSKEEYTKIANLLKNRLDTLFKDCDDMNYYYDSVSRINCMLCNGKPMVDAIKENFREQKHKNNPNDIRYLPDDTTFKSLFFDEEFATTKKRDAYKESDRWKVIQESRDKEFNQYMFNEDGSFTEKGNKLIMDTIISNIYYGSTIEVFAPNAKMELPKKPAYLSIRGEGENAYQEILKNHKQTHEREEYYLSSETEKIGIYLADVRQKAIQRYNEKIKILRGVVTEASKRMEARANQKTSLDWYKERVDDKGKVIQELPDEKAKEQLRGNMNFLFEDVKKLYQMNQHETELDRGDFIYIEGKSLNQWEDEYEKNKDSNDQFQYNQYHPEHKPISQQRKERHEELQNKLLERAALRGNEIVVCPPKRDLSGLCDDVVLGPNQLSAFDQKLSKVKNKADLFGRKKDFDKKDCDELHISLKEGKNRNNSLSTAYIMAQRFGTTKKGQDEKEDLLFDEQNKAYDRLVRMSVISEQLDQQFQEIERVSERFNNGKPIERSEYIYIDGVPLSEIRRNNYNQSEKVVEERKFLNELITDKTMAVMKLTEELAKPNTEREDLESKIRQMNENITTKQENIDFIKKKMAEKKELNGGTFHILSDEEKMKINKINDEIKEKLKDTKYDGLKDQKKIELLNQEINKINFSIEEKNQEKKNIKDLPEEVKKNKEAEKDILQEVIAKLNNQLNDLTKNLPPATRYGVADAIDRNLRLGAHIECYVPTKNMESVQAPYIFSKELNSYGIEKLTDIKKYTTEMGEAFENHGQGLPEEYNRLKKELIIRKTVEKVPEEERVYTGTNYAKEKDLFGGLGL